MAPVLELEPEKLGPVHEYVPLLTDVALKLVLVPAQIILVPVIVGVIGKLLIVAVTAVLVAVVQPFAVASTKYVVVFDKGGVVKLVPVVIGLPPTAAAYHDTVPVGEVAPSVTVPVPQRTFEVTLFIIGVAFKITTCDAVELHPEEVLVILALYVPPVVAVTTCVVADDCPVHW